MKVYSDTLTDRDLVSHLPDGVTIYTRPIRTRKRARGWHVELAGHAARHTHRKNSGEYGARDESLMSATWDDHGEWMAALYEIDPDALIAFYTSRSHFYEVTEQHAKWRQRSRLRWIRETGRAPWLDPGYQFLGEKVTA